MSMNRVSRENIEKEVNKKPKKVNIFALAFIMLCLFVIITNPTGETAVDNHNKDNIYYQIVLKNILPDIVVKEEELVVNEAGKLDIILNGYDNKMFNDYKDKCINNGFVLSSQYKDNASYSAYNKDSYKLELTYDHTNSSMRICIQYDNTITIINWSDYSLLTNIPEYKQCVGNVISSTDDELNLSLNHISLDAYKQYVNECKNKGFTLNKKQTDHTYQAKHKNGDSLHMEYSNESITLTVKVPVYQVDMEVKWWGDLWFKNFDINVLVDGRYRGTVNTEEKTNMSMNLSKGQHTVTFVSVEDKTLFSSDTITVNESTKFRYSTQLDVDVIVIERDDYLHVGYINEDLGKLKIDEVLKKYKDLGYKDITVFPNHNLDKNNYNKYNGIVNRISINFKDSLKKTDRFYSNATVIIHHHSAMLLTFPGHSSELIKLSLDEVVDYLKNLGFTNIAIKPYGGITEGNKKVNNIYEISINGETKFKQGDKFAFDAPIVITYYK